MNEKEEMTGELVTVSQTALGTLEKASIDTQISTAHQWPRSIAKFRENAIAIVTLDEDTAASCIYRRPVGKDQNGKETYAEGMSVRMAEIVGNCYGNLRVGARLVEQTAEQVVAQGVAHDLESNFLSTSEVVESTLTKFGKPMSPRMRVVIAKAALAKARRDAIFQVVPKALAKPLETAARNLLFGNSTSISHWREKTVEWIAKLGIDEKRVWNALQIQGADDLKQPEFEILLGIKTALQNGDTDVDTAFPPIEAGSRFTQPQKKVPEVANDAPEQAQSGTGTGNLV